MAPTCSARASTPRWRRSSASRIYIGLRFRFAFAIGAIAATLHDILITLAFLFFAGYDLSLNVVAAILTITGYSVNDTIVIFDRVRENLRTKRRDSLENVVNQSVNQTLSRTVITAGTTFLAVLSLYLFGGEVLEGLRVHDAGRHHQRHLFDGLHRGGDCHSRERQAGEGPRDGLAQGVVSGRGAGRDVDLFRPRCSASSRDSPSSCRCRARVT